MHLVTAQQMRQIDREMISGIGVSAGALMELAGRAAALATEGLVAQIARPRVHIVAGKGHNGGDGLVAGRHLLSRGLSAIAWLAFPEPELAELTASELRAFLKCGGRLAGAEDRLEDADLIVDALVGTGSRLPLDGPVRSWCLAIRQTGRPVLAIDLPSGIDADTGAADSAAIRAVCTIALGFAKPGLFQHPGKAHSGKIILEDLTMPRTLAPAAGADISLFDRPAAIAVYRHRPDDSHKGTFGKVAILAGSKGMYGAARLASHAVCRAGAGLVHYLLPADMPASALAAFPAEIVAVPLSALSGEWSEEGLRSAAASASAATAALLGPGLGPEFRSAVAAHPERIDPFSKLDIPLILDADFLGALSALPDRGKAWLSSRQGPTAITPHPLEFARLAGISTESVQADRVRLARKYAKDHGVIVALKGSGTVTASPDGTVRVNSTGNSGLASAGTGDVLAGTAAGLSAVGYPLQDAVALAVWIHGRSAELACESELTEETLTASDLFDWIASAFREIAPA